MDDIGGVRTPAVKIIRRIWFPDFAGAAPEMPGNISAQ
jgi:hypothetical protein